MLHWFKKKSTENFLKVDIHSHLIPAIDDGVKTLEESLAVILKLKSYGIKKIITTPHIIESHYPNSADIILKGLEEVKEALREKQIDIEIEAAAEYYFDESLMKKIKSNEPLLSFGKNYVLIEIGFMTKPLGIQEAFFELISNGYTPVLAHPERYLYLHNDLDFLIQIKNMGVKLQVNALSFVGHYSASTRRFTKILVDKKMIDFIGSDVHHIRHASLCEKVYSSRLFQKCRQLDLLNNAL